MPSPNLRSAHRLLGWSTATLGALCVAIVGVSYLQSESMEGLLVRQPKEYPWISLSQQEVMSGATIPPDTNVVFHLPETGFTRLSRETLLGLKGKRTRYWGYCFPANYDPKNVDRRRGFPGLIFLSEKERASRAELERARKPRISINRLPSAEEIEQLNQRQALPIRHQLEVFEPAMMCFVMSEDALAIGLDPDGDRLNDQLERELTTNPALPDSDGDGITDGVEHLRGTIPSVRDTDGDGIIDGIEDSDWDGYIDPGETDPRNRDSDRDGLCDGMCRVRVKRQNLFIGEDKNLNGEMDDGETDPNNWDSDGDGATDEIEFLKCVAEGKAECP